MPKQQDADLPLVCVQGLGFVGAAMALAVADARDDQGRPCYQVVGLDLPNPLGRARIEALNQGRFPFAHADPGLESALGRARAAGNLSASEDPALLARASVIVLDVNFDISREKGAGPGMESFRQAVSTVAEHLAPGCLVLVETTVPPGTCQKVVAPILEEGLARRGLPTGAYLLAHSYERVMPGENYLDSIVRFWRVYAGHTPQAAEACGQFLAKIIDVDSFPLSRLGSTTASELGKVLENSYRAANIAFIEEWGRFAEELGVDLFEVLDAIRMRPTHNNIRQPGFGVGGYCLTKDPLLADYAARELFGLQDQEFFLSLKALEINREMPLVSLDKLDLLLGGLGGKTLLLLGVSYRQEVSDTRHSPSQLFVEEARRRGTKVLCHDPMVSHWQEMDMDIPAELPPPRGLDAVVLAVPHLQYKALDLAAWLEGNKPLILDANNVLNAGQRESLLQAGCRLYSIGRGEARP
jgi:nucleotide sugar dehydrogenase